MEEKFTCVSTSKSSHCLEREEIHLNKVFEKTFVNAHNLKKKLPTQNNTGLKNRRLLLPFKHNHIKSSIQSVNSVYKTIYAIHHRSLLNLCEEDKSRN